MSANQSPTLRLQAFEAMEREQRLFDPRIDGWSAWRVMRNAVHQVVLALPLSAPTRPRVKRSWQALAATARLLWLLTVVGRRELLVKTCRSALRVPLGRQFRDVYFDGLLQRGFTCLKLEDVNSLDFDKQARAAWRPSDLDPVVFTFWGRVLGTLWPVDAGRFCERVSELLKRELNVALDPLWLRARVSTVYWQARLYALLLARVRPKAVLVSDTGEYALRIACSRRGIRFIELQHGVFDARHPDAVPSWARGSAAELLLPDVLACYGGFWIDALAGTRQGTDCCLAVGNELIDMARAQRRRRVPGGCAHIVLTSQGLDTQALARWVADMLAQAPEGLAWRLSIKLHPMYDIATTDYDRLAADARVCIVGGTAQPNVYALLADADLHLSISSACLFDAAALGVPSMVIPLAGHEVVNGGRAEALLGIAHTPADVWRQVLVAPADETHSHRFAKPGFLDNMQTLVS